MTQRQRNFVKRLNGFTLVEMLVSIALGLAVLVGVSAVYVSAKQSFRFQETAGRLQEDATFALESMARDLRMAGYAGCKGIDASTPMSSLVSFPAAVDGPNPLAAVYPTDVSVTAQALAPNNFIRGFDATVPASMFSGTAPSTGTTDSIFFSGGSANGISLSSTMANASAVLAISADPFKWSNALPANNDGAYYFVVSDCNSSSLFKGVVNTAGTQIDHGVGVGTSPNTNSAATFVPIPPGVTPPIYGADAILMPLEWSFYYVATRTGASTPSLYRLFYNGNVLQTQELVSNIESMRLQYGENLQGTVIGSNPKVACVLTVANCTPTTNADVWRTSAAAVTDWSHVVAVRVGLMVVGDDNTAVPAELAASTPKLLNQNYTLPAGASVTRLRKEFSTTVVLRNRVAS